MALSDEQKKRIEDLALGQAVDRRKPVEDQIAALRKQIVAISDAVNVPFVTDFQELEDIVTAEKAKKR